MGRVNKTMRKSIREAILEQYKFGNNPHDASQKIQKMFGLNFETRYTTIRLWFEQFYLGDENLDNDPFREDLLPKRRTESRKCTEVASNTSTETTTKTSSSSSPNSFNDTQTKLLFELKEQVDLLYKKINAQNCCLQIVDRFLKKLNPTNRILKTGPHQTPVEIFYWNYRFLREKSQKLPNKSSNRNNFYDILYDSLYCVDDKKKKKDGNRRRKNSGTLKKSKRKNKNRKRLPNSSNQGPKRKGGRPKIPINKEDQLPAKCEKCDKVLKNRFRLKIHIQHIHERTDRKYCTFEGCDVNYANQLTLNRHIRIVHTKDAREYRCTWAGCSYFAYTSNLLQKHLNVHTGERPYKCVWPGCDKAFKSHSTLAFHKSIHENKRKHKCHWPGCGYACNVSSNLRKHTAIHERKRIQISDRECV